MMPVNGQSSDLRARGIEILIASIGERQPGEMVVRHKEMVLWRCLGWLALVSWNRRVIL
jgi:hypothetical protein